METTASSSHDQLFPPIEQNWADKLFIAGLMIYSFCSSFSIAASQIGLGLALIAFIVLYRTGRVGIKATAFDKPYAFLVLTGFLAAFRAEMPIIGIKGLKTLLIIICFLLPYWAQLRNPLRFKLLGLSVFSATLVAAFAILTVYLGTAPGDRATGFFSMSLTFGECQAMLSLLILAWFCRDNNTPRSSGILLISFIITAAAVFLSLQRGVWIGFVGGVAYLLFWRCKKVSAAMILLLIILAPVAYYHEAFHNRLSGFNIKKTLDLYNNKPFAHEFEDGVFEANYLRPTTWTRGFQMIQQHPVFGVGHKNLKHWYEKLSSEYEHHRCFIFSHQHSNFMQMLAAGGFISLIAFFYTIISILKFVRQPDSGENFRQFAAAAIFIAFILFGLTENAWGDEEVGMMAFFLTGLLLSQPREIELPG
ncbi:MAG: hypothetical protein A2W80_18650 [Candidatus Riflebacteria bacterium GWC2_50_8]|nr:MAG: hypothetical protein A2W80_18650 [Candidatus Riflebacteria bacterium GWC2_50_8]